MQSSFNQRRNRKLGCFLSLLFIGGCATSPNINSKFHHDQSDYEQIMYKHTQTIEKLQGLYNVFSVAVTELTSQVQMLQLNKRANDYQWSDKQFDDERTKTLDNLRKESKFFLSFFTPKRKHDDLDLGSSIWRIYLDHDGKRYSGTIQKYSGVFEEIRSYYPAHSQWATAYTVTFPVPMSLVEGANVNLTITGPLGNATLVFTK